MNRPLVSLVVIAVSLAAEVVLVQPVASQPASKLGRTVFDSAAMSTRPSARPSSVASGYGPYYDYIGIGGGNLQIIISNFGSVGGDLPEGVTEFYDPITADAVRATKYPRQSRITYSLNWYIAVGAVSDNDTIVADYFSPDAYPQGAFKIRTFDAASPLYDPEARANIDAICSYMDTAKSLREAKRSLGIKVTQRTLAWFAPNVYDFILVNYRIQNIGTKMLRHVYVDMASNAGASGGAPLEYPGRADDLSGYLKSWRAPEGCGFIDTINLVYGMDNDGDPSGGRFTEQSPLGAAGLMFLSVPVATPQINYNWWSQVYRPTGELGGWAPQKKGEPRIDWSFPIVYHVNKYRWMSELEFDFDQMWAGVDKTSEGWMPPDSWARLIDSGGITWHDYSFGEFNLDPGQQTEFTVAVVAGNNVIVGPTDWANRYYPADPSFYYAGLNFSELALHARWAKWVYDNPGVDTDGDGYFGKFQVCDGDTQWYEGDGIADYRADVPPPSPKLKVIPSLGKLGIRWNGYYSENAIDPFTKIKDFEGYRVYTGLDDRESSMSLLISWDYENFNRYAVLLQPNGTYAWINKDLPLTLDSLRVLYGDGFSPLLYTKDNPWHWNDSLYSFARVDYNMSQFSSSGVHKVYPEARKLGTDTSQWTPDDLTTEHGERLPKYYEYEYVFNNVLPTIAQYVSVTAFDFGFAQGHMPSRESQKHDNLLVSYAQNSADSVETKDLNVYVYPNPYLFNVNYAAQGYENHDNRQIAARSHRLNFGNLPPKCRISIYSLDGDLIRSWEHDYNPSDPQAMHDSWDLITRNTMLPAAGLYYWTVESPTRTQIGKFVIIE